MITKDLGAVSAYAYAVEKGYTGTEEEYAELMASYASVAEEAAESAESAQASATTANSAASTATNKASEATTAAQTATAKAEEAQADADAAALDASQALSAASTATSKASEAAQSASDAVTAKTAAQTAQTAAEGSATTAQTAAQTATTKAAEAAESARTLTIDPTLSQSGQAADAKVVGDEITDLKSGLSDNGLLIVTNYADVNGYISNRGVISAYGDWKHTNPIFLKKLETISFAGTSINSGIAMISIVNANGTVLNPVVFGVDNTVRTYEFTAANDCYVSVSHISSETDIKKGIKQAALQEIYADLKFYRGKNLINADDVIDGYYVHTDGKIYSQEAFCYTKHLIPCLPNTAYATTHSGSIFIVYYDENKEYISGVTANATTFITPDNAKFMRISFSIEHKIDCMVLLASEKDRSYAPYVYGYSVKNLPNAYRMNRLYVGSDKEFQTITSALNSITDATEYNRYTIHVSKGTYQETFSTKNYVDIEGDDKYKTIIDYTNADDSDYTNKSTIFATSFSKLKNLTISTKGTKYPVHCDGAYGLPYRVIIENCILKHNGFTTLSTQAGTAIGIGLYENQHVEIIDSECIASGVFGCASIYCHNANDTEAKSGYRSIRVEHSTLSNSTYGFRLEAIESNNYQDNDAWLIGIVNNGETPIRNTHATKDSWHLFQYS